MIRQLTLRRLRRLFRWLTLVFLGAYLVGFVCLFLGPLWSTVAPNVPLPLGGIQDVVVDSRDRVYVRLGFYSRIQVYDRRGKYLYGFFTAGSGRVRLGFDDRGNLCVASTRSDTVYVYRTDGSLIGRRPGALETIALWKRRQLSWNCDSLGYTYHVRRGLFTSHITKVSREGGEKLFLADPLWAVPFAGPVPCFLVLSFVATLNVLVEWIYKRRQREFDQVDKLAQDGNEGLHGGCSSKKAQPG